MKKFQKNNVSWLEFPRLQAIATVRHAVFLRHGGNSPAPWDSLNLANNVGDDEKWVETNRSTIQSILQAKRLVSCLQEHKTKALFIQEESDLSIAGTADILFTDKIGIALSIQHADCQAAIFYDPRHHALAVVHAGWRGSAANIYSAAVSGMQQRWDSRPSELIAAIGPSLGPCHAQFIHWRSELPEELWPFQCAPDYFDFWALSQTQLIQCGLKENNIEIARICTFCQAQDFFSYRRCSLTGRHATVAMLL